MKKILTMALALSLAGCVSNTKFDENTLNYDYEVETLDLALTDDEYVYDPVVYNNKAYYIINNQNDNMTDRIIEMDIKDKKSQIVYEAKDNESIGTVGILNESIYIVSLDYAGNKTDIIDFTNNQVIDTMEFDGNYIDSDFFKVNDQLYYTKLVNDEYKIMTIDQKNNLSEIKSYKTNSEYYMPSHFTASSINGYFTYVDNDEHIILIHDGKTGNEYTIDTIDGYYAYKAYVCDEGYVVIYEKEVNNANKDVYKHILYDLKDGKKIKEYETENILVVEDCEDVLMAVSNNDRNFTFFDIDENHELHTKVLETDGKAFGFMKEGYLYFTDSEGNECIAKIMHK